MVDTERFQLKDIEWSFAKSREITGDRNPRRPIKTGIKSIKATCKSCSYTWHARAYGEGRLTTFVGGFILICPSCNAEEKINNTILEAISKKPKQN
ncbi:DNA-directed RNA polymerase subunit M/transcription elongation factor TFIIS [Desulfosalsimonas propionicica]|uniref:DNA-directed RNA polymerase subunit M/transcription elongation factor TFIIS n=1 Tax=Desulfosalsimonas propionicica TaxID=332175 RepID=A0A7W0HM37_9BACT|nr:hypothetical protein [Desulfosalsimonas propionicica]MBA2882994.1 DNA-directed RNA polymerase subunit M/transcription elongation factor TFIIS [Desulfosalsimonas propionicica]